MHYFSSDFKLGILGGGQLGKMLLYTTRRWDVQTFVLDPSSEAPSRFACNHFVQGDLKDFETVYQFGKKVDVLTIEIEHVGYYSNHDKGHPLCLCDTTEHCDSALF